MAKEFRRGNTGVVSLLVFAAWLAVAWWPHRELAAVVSSTMLIATGLLSGRTLPAHVAPAP